MPRRRSGLAGVVQSFGAGRPADLSETLREMEERDKRDSERRFGAATDGGRRAQDRFFECQR